MSDIVLEVLAMIFWRKSSTPEHALLGPMALGATQLVHCCSWSTGYQACRNGTVGG